MTNSKFKSESPIETGASCDAHDIALLGILVFLQEVEKLGATAVYWAVQATKATISSESQPGTRILLCDE